MYIWEEPNWPEFEWDADAVLDPLLAATHEQALLLGTVNGLGFQFKDEAYLATLTSDVVESSAIEGERLSPEHVRSSIARRLGMDIGGAHPSARHVEGVVEMMLDATRCYREPLTVQRLQAWHGSLFPTGRSGLQEIKVAQWRDDADGPMQVTDNRVGSTRVYFEAPPASRLPMEMERFLNWFETVPMRHLTEVAVAHLYFVTLHPFEDGNGRIARAIADMALARHEGSGQRFYSVSSQIHTEKDDYYAMLERTQKGTVDITQWLVWFLRCLERAVKASGATLTQSIQRARYWQSWTGLDLNERQVKVLNRVLGDKGEWEGKLTLKKYMAIAKAPQATAGRDLKSLLDMGVLVKEPGGGRSTSYSLAALQD